jgi:hypothetical protein
VIPAKVVPTQTAGDSLRLELGVHVEGVVAFRKAEFGIAQAKSVAYGCDGGKHAVTNMHDGGVGVDLLVLALERDRLLSVLAPEDVDAPGAAAHGAVLLEGLFVGPAGVDVDLRGFAAVGAAELGSSVSVEVELLHHPTGERT